VRADEDLSLLTAADAAEAIRAGNISSEALVAACLARIAKVDEGVQAWVHLEPSHAMKQAAEADLARRSGKALGPLHGVPVGVKDIFDTRDMPTEDGTVLHAGRRPLSDAWAVTQLRNAGAIVLGKTVTTELAVYAPGKTLNPHDAERTPGGSSSGSAAAVAAHMVPLALGSQTNGSVIRPAAFCGVYGFKPSFGFISRHGVLRLSRSLDHIGVFARSIEDVALLAEVLMAFDPRDPDMVPRGPAYLNKTALARPPVTPRFAFVRTPHWDVAEADTSAAFAELAEALGNAVEEVVLPEPFNEAAAWHRTIMEADLAKNLAREYAQGKDRLSTVLREMIERGQSCLAVDYTRALERRDGLTRLLAPIFEEYDAILTPAAPGEAPLGLASTGDPIFATIWTLCGLPAITVPLLTGSNGMPMGVQLVAARGDDGRLLRTAHWLVDHVRAGAEE
jgi:Asp-tRNA(Asn)/Glu-tRNA(Gln) amidotransferase A subunit family amidase